LITAAYEVALAFSLEHARYLAWLARRVVIPDQDGRGAGRQFDDLYRTYELPKKAGGTRTITAPYDNLKRLQRQLLTRGLLHIPVHRSAHGFRAGRSVLTNALPHVRQPLVVNVDIRAFFPSTPYAAIVDVCSKLAGGRLSPAAVRLVADICAYGGALPTGAPTSPAIANIILAPVDRALSRAAARWRIRYTRYADDLTFSGRGEVHRIIPFVKRLLAEHGYEIDDSKTNLFRQGRRQMVTGLVVNQKPNLPRRLRRRLRAAVHRRLRGLPATWHDRPMGDDELAGRLAVLNLVQPEEARRLRDGLRQVANARAEGGEAV
jgi:retron-type reverse transcriptase